MGGEGEGGGEGWRGEEGRFVWKVLRFVGEGDTREVHMKYSE